MDYKNDRKKAAAGAFKSTGGDLDAVLVRHPMAQGLLTYTEGVVWAGGWGLVAMTGAWLLNPVCLWIFLGGCLLEALYCLLWDKSPYRAVVNGIVKTLGAVAAVYAVDPTPNPAFVADCLDAFFLGNRRAEHSQRLDRYCGGSQVGCRDHSGSIHSRQCQLLIMGSLLLTLLLCRIFFGIAQESI